MFIFVRIYLDLYTLSTHIAELFPFTMLVKNDNAHLLLQLYMGLVKYNIDQYKMKSDITQFCGIHDSAFSKKWHEIQH